MKAAADEKLIPQTEEEISEIVWAKKEELQKIFLKYFPNN